MGLGDAFRNENRRETGLDHKGGGGKWAPKHVPRPQKEARLSEGGRGAFSWPQTGPKTLVGGKGERALNGIQKQQSKKKKKGFNWNDLIRGSPAGKEGEESGQGKKERKWARRAKSARAHNGEKRSNSKRMHGFRKLSRQKKKKRF